MSASISNFVSEAVIGSLPKGLTDQEKARIAASLPMSPALNTLADLPKVSPIRLGTCPLHSTQ
jgi:hypothetical protein